jgi:hypothetical protein
MVFTPGGRTQADCWTLKKAGQFIGIKSRPSYGTVIPEGTDTAARLQYFAHACNFNFRLTDTLFQSVTGLLSATD